MMQTTFAAIRCNGNGCGAIFGWMGYNAYNFKENII